MSTFTYADIFEIYAQTIEGLKQQSLHGEFDNFWCTFPRDPIFIAKGLEALYGVKISIKYRDFYQNLNDVPDESRDLFCFHEHFADGRIHIYLNTNRMEVGRSLLSKSTVRFVLLKEVFIAVIRREFLRKGRPYPDTVDYGVFGSSILDIIAEKPSIYDIGGNDDSPVPSVENAAEILALMFLIDLEEVFNARNTLLLGNGESGDMGFTLFDYRKLSKRYGVRVRFVSIFVKTRFIQVAIDGLKKFLQDFRKLLPTVKWD